MHSELYQYFPVILIPFARTRIEPRTFRTAWVPLTGDLFRESALCQPPHHKSLHAGRVQHTTLRPRPNVRHGSSSAEPLRVRGTGRHLQ